MKYSQEFKEQLIQEYKNGKSTYAIAKEYKLNSGTVYWWVKKAGEKIRPKKIYSESFRKKVVAGYEDGASSIDLGHKYNVSSRSVLDWVHKYSNVRSRSEAQRIRCCDLNESAFDILEGEGIFYVLGLLSSDGSLGPQNEVQLAMTDREGPEMLKEILEYGGPIEERERKEPRQNLFRLKFHSKKLFNRLRELQIKSNPTFSFNANYIRGLWDGDGCISHNFVQSSGKKLPIAKFYNQKMPFHIGIQKYFWKRGWVFATNRVNGCVQTELRGQNAIYFFWKIYRGAKYFLQRKYDLAMQWIEKGYP